MAATGVARAGTRVAMVWPPKGTIALGVVDLHAAPDESSELVDQAHFGERIRVLGESTGWRYVQGEDLYLGWIRRDAAFVFTGAESRIVASLFAPIRDRADVNASVLGHLPVGTELPEFRHYIPEGPGLHREVPSGAGPWREVHLARSAAENRMLRGFVSIDDTVPVADLPQRYPTSADLLATAQSFIGVRYLWGGTTARGMDCSGLVQQVYRLNGVALPRDADQQAMLGRQVEKARPGDLMFFGADSVTHVALATGETEFLHAPMKGGVVERGRLDGERKLRSIRRYLADGARTQPA